MLLSINYLFIHSSLKGYRESEWEVSERLKRGQRHGWLSGHPDLTESEAAEIIRRQARQLLGGNLEKLGVNVSDSFFNTKTEGNHEDKTDIRILGSVKSQGPSHDLTELQIVPKKVESTPLRDNTSCNSYYHL